jgi:prepilin-type N-terminal cleavage/methylation domain-containing protein
MRKRSGFTMIELMVVVAIIAFLAVVSIPSFMKFFAKAKRTEAYMNLHALYAAQKSHWLEHGRYSTALSGPDGIGWQPEGYSGGGPQERFYYTYGFPGSEGKNYCTGKLATSATYLDKAHANDKEFLALAVGDIDNDGVPDIIGIDHNNVITIIQDDISS